jgi:hypothetical protein
MKPYPTIRRSGMKGQRSIANRGNKLTVHIEPAASEMKHPFLVAG